MWSFVEEPWQYRVLDQLPPGVDRTLLERALAMTPTERLDAAIDLMETGEALRAALASQRPRR